MARALILDFNRTLFDPDTGELFPGVLELLEAAAASRELFLYSKREGGRDTLINDLGIDHFFRKVYFADRKDGASVKAILDEHDVAVAESYVIGDLITSELQAGYDAGVETIWVRQGKFADREGSFEPTHTVRSIAELHELLKTLP